ncbi:E3 ubiquitin-protein ligase WAV3 [Impatiens glandulifera]|uniref:E3 ubiquitin-protein ligase WAV3 n=1 Tax=Impatiens glandulifera TaxID=253017 RepID=UPI001FB0A37C|nr:E3 ubiquitin-protein ligase WAV3 [Impatiens glandulifera]XP_047310219.1 E3 ubiquitin-protein ligase WAV3 [Impatiens glandulifera]
MGSKWRKAKMALSCLYVPSSTDDSSPTNRIGERFSDAALLSPSPSSIGRSSDVSMPKTPMPSSAGLLLPKHSSKSSKRTCAICLTNMKPGQGHAIFTAECSHSFHFHCITSNVKHGNQICPICRAKWREVPLKSPASDLSNRKSRANAGGLHQDASWTTVFRRSPAPRADANRHTSSFFHTPPEPATFDDDEHVDDQSEILETGLSKKTDTHDHTRGALEIKTYPEVSAISKSASQKDFNVLIHLKAVSSMIRNSGKNENNARAPVDLVTVLDVSGSMAGTKLALVKRAMGFVIQHLGPSDRLSVIAFSSTARRVFSLRRMTDDGKQDALQAVNSLLSSGGTNIAEGLRKGAKVVIDRKWKNPVTSIILLSDGQDTYTISSPGGQVKAKADYHSLIPSSIHHDDGGSGIHIPVHAFGFGSDHDAALMHSVSEASGGTFSFIEAENAIQDAFAQCIGGLLSVVVQELNLKIECVNSMIKLGSVKAGSYKSRLNPDSRTGFISVGDLYADEERDFLVEVNIPADGSSDNTTLLRMSYSYKDPITKEVANVEEPNKVEIERPAAVTGKLIVSMEVDRQRNRVTAAEAIAKARSAAEQGDLSVAVSVLEDCRKEIWESISAQAGDKLCMGLCAELKEMQERMASRKVYETSGRAYVLSGLSSHSWQRATARGDSTDSTTLLQSYQTPSMVDMVSRSQTMYLGTPSSSSSSSSSRNRLLRQSMSFPAGGPQPR